MTFLRIVILLYFLFEHDLFGKPVPLFRIVLYSTGTTSTATPSFCLREPTMMPSTGETSEKSRPTARMMWSFWIRRSLVGSKPTHPISLPHHTDTQAWVASAPCRRG